MTDGPDEDIPGYLLEDTPPLTVIEGGKSGDARVGKLTAKQLGFVNSILAGANQVTAYKENYSTGGMADKTCWEAASRLFANSKVSARIKAGQARQEQAAVHTGLSLRLHVERQLFDLSTKADSDAACIRATELLGKLEKVGAFVERTADVSDDRSPDEIRAELEARLKKAFSE